MLLDMDDMCSNTSMSLHTAKDMHDGSPNRISHTYIKKSIHSEAIQKIIIT